MVKKNKSGLNFKTIIKPAIKAFLSGLLVVTLAAAPTGEAYAAGTGTDKSSAEKITIGLIDGPASSTAAADDTGNDEAGTTVKDVLSLVGTPSLAEAYAAQEAAAAEAAAAAAAEAAAAEAAAAEAAAAEAGAAEATYYEEDYVGGIQNDDGTVTDAQTGEVYSSASEYSASTGNEIVDRAYSMLGSSYRYGGTGADGSFDCSGLVGYALTGTNERIGNTLTFMEYNQVSDPQPGDIVVSEGHTGIYIGDGQMIHAQDEDTGVVVGKVQDDMIYVRP